MNYDRPELRQMLAAEYALGTLCGPARRRFETLLKTDRQLRAELVFWEARLAQLGLDLAPVAPDAKVWTAIQKGIKARVPDTPPPAPSRQGRWWHSLAFWRGAFVIAAAVDVALAVLLWLSY